MAKRWAILIAVLCFSLLFWSSISSWFAGDVDYRDLHLWILPSIFLTLLLAVLGLAFIAVKNLWMRLLISGIVGAAYLFFFGAKWMNLIGVGILIIVFIIEAIRIDGIVANRIKVDIYSLMRAALIFLVVPILILISFAYFSAPQVQKSAKQPEVPESIQRAVGKSIDIILGPKLNSLSDVEKQQFRTSINNETNNHIRDIMEEYAKYMPPILAFGLYLVLQGVSFIFVWIAAAWAAILYRLLLRLRFFKLTKQPIEVERIENI